MFARLLVLLLLFVVPTFPSVAAERRTPVVEAVAKAGDAGVSIRP